MSWCFWSDIVINILLIKLFTFFKKIKITFVLQPKYSPLGILFGFHCKWLSWKWHSCWHRHLRPDLWNKGLQQRQQFHMISWIHGLGSKVFTVSWKQAQHRLIFSPDIPSLSYFIHKSQPSGCRTRTNLLYQTFLSVSFYGCIRYKSLTKRQHTQLGVVSKYQRCLQRLEHHKHNA